MQSTAKRTKTWIFYIWPHKSAADYMVSSKYREVFFLSSLVKISLKILGLKFINCKSGKDRTGMAATLEQIQILSREYDLAEHEYQKALDAMRRLVWY